MRLKREINIKDQWNRNIAESGIKHQKSINQWNISPTVVCDSNTPYKIFLKKIIFDCLP